MANMILTCGLILCLSTISCYGFLDNNLGKEDKLGSFGCSDLPSPTNGVNGPLTTASFSKSQKLSDDFELKWNFNSTHILFQAHVKIQGYIGLGISNTNAMAPSDLMVAWVDANQVTHLTDRHVESKTLPTVDDHQDWFLVSGKEEGDYTTINVIRPLDPCDEQDKPIKSGKNWVIYALSSSEPQNEDEDITYHGLNRGVHAIDLLGN